MALPTTPPARPATHRLFARPELLIVLAIGAFVRFWQLFTPRAVVFDEYHYLRYSGHYFSHRFYFDLHPPLAKLLYAGLAKLLSIPQAVLLHPYPAPALRIMPALCGTLTVALVYILLTQLGGSRPIAALGALAVALDNALVADSRLILLEPLLIFFGLLGVVCFFAARSRTGAARWSLLVASGVASGCAASVKWTGLSALGLILCIWLYDWLRARSWRPRAFLPPVILAGLSVAVYLVCFAIHFSLLTKSSEGTDDDFVSIQYRATLNGDLLYNPNARISFLARLRDTQRAIDYSNRELEAATHPGASPWYTWPIMKHPIGMWISPGKAPPGRAQPFIILLGNPVVWWGGLVGIGLAILLLAWWRARVRPYRFALAVLLGGYAINYLPFIPITRLMYLYHYLFALIWIAMLGALTIGIVGGWAEQPDDASWRFPSARSRVTYAAIVALIVIGFVYFSPFTYGFGLSSRAYDQHFWVLHPHL
ncbi:MAG TPA: phospholipid carrier-dependent glycosyltransferase [Gemmatimonadaceae bacterium]|nr:phospholipid carrier-dependent glycosyltransferase [Gemmatimonadaceae bacterium]